jgi:hypothetical protein
VTAAEAEAALRAAGFVEDSAEAEGTLIGLLQQPPAHFPDPLSLAWRQLVTLQQWAADTEPRHSRSSALAVDTLQQALLAQQQRSRIVSLIWDCGRRPQLARPVPVRHRKPLLYNEEVAATLSQKIAEDEAAFAVAEAAHAAAVQEREAAPAPRFTEGLYNNVKEELLRALSGHAQLVNKLVHLVVTQRRLEAVEWPS